MVKKSIILEKYPFIKAMIKEAVERTAQDIASKMGSRLMSVRNKETPSTFVSGSIRRNKGPKRHGEFEF